MKRPRIFPFVKTWLAAASCVLAALFLIEACTDVPSTQVPFPDYGYKPPADEYNGPLFKLSQDYPTQMPDGNQLPAFFNTDFQRDWRNYMMQVRDYCFEGNTEVDWRVENNNVRHWYHMPWQHYGRTGREAIHGLTQEAPLLAGQLANTQTNTAVAHAVGFYNEFGGYTIGQVWKDHIKPNPRFVSKEGFPIGTVVCKLLFVDVPNTPPEKVAEQVPFLAHPIQWQAYTANGFNPPESKPELNRRVTDVTLIQMDIMIRDDRAPSGWIFGTFQYNGNLNNTSAWNNLIPVGLMWGNDPDYADNHRNIPVIDSSGKWPKLQPLDRTPINAGLKETIINPDTNELPATHLGWDGRLNGPVDNPRSSCMSCHMTASYQAPDLSPLFVDPSQRPSPDSPEWDTWWMQWFQNVGWKNGKLEKFKLRKFTPNELPKLQYSLDFSLQLSAALQNFEKSGTVKPAKTPENAIER